MPSIRSRRPRYEQTKWLMCAERIPLVPISVCGYQMAKRSPWLFVPRGEVPCKHTHVHSLTLYLSSLAHHTLFSMCTPQALPTLHRGSSLCGAVALPLTPPRPFFHPCSTAMDITSSTCVASIRRHAGACQPRRGDRHLQVIRPRSGNTGRQMGCFDRCLPPTYPSSGMLDVTAPSPPLFEPFVTRPLLRLGSPAAVRGP